MRGGGARGGSSVLAWGGSGVVPAGGGSYIRYGDNAAMSGALPAVTAPQHLITAPYAGICRNLFARISAVLGAGITCAYTLYVNEVASALTCQIGGAAQVDNSDVTNVVTVAAGDRLYLVGTRVAGVPPNVILVGSLEFVRL